MIFLHIAPEKTHIDPHVLSTVTFLLHPTSAPHRHRRTRALRVVPHRALEWSPRSAPLRVLLLETTCLRASPALSPLSGHRHQVVEVAPSRRQQLPGRLLSSTNQWFSGSRSVFQGVEASSGATCIQTCWQFRLPTFSRTIELRSPNLLPNLFKGQTKLRQTHKSCTILMLGAPISRRRSSRKRWMDLT